MGIQGTVGRQPAVVLLSGGLDSATCLAMAGKGHEVHALTFDYGGRHSRELDAAREIAGHFGVKHHTVMKVELDAIGGSSLTDRSISPGLGKGPDEIGESLPNTYVPARNMTFLSLGLALAESVGAESVFIGANSVDYSGYPDCRPEFLDAFREAARLGTRVGTRGSPVSIEAPLLRMSKADIIKMGAELGVPFGMTWTCYLGRERACGRCEACTLRLEGFREAGLDDPIEYEH